MSRTQTTYSAIGEAVEEKLGVIKTVSFLQIVERETKRLVLEEVQTLEDIKQPHVSLSAKSDVNLLKKRNYDLAMIQIERAEHLHEVMLLISQDGLFRRAKSVIVNYETFEVKCYDVNLSQDAFEELMNIK